MLFFPNILFKKFRQCINTYSFRAHAKSFKISNHQVAAETVFNLRKGINHGFECINIRRVPRKVFEHEAKSFVRGGPTLTTFFLVMRGGSIQIPL